MNNQIRKSTLLLVIVVIIGTIYFLERNKPESSTEPIIEISDTTTSTTDKAAKYPSAKEISNPSGFINTEPLNLADLIGKQVIMVDFWTYSCINCQRTTPYLNDWHEKYGAQGLTIVGIHTPEFEFEKDIANVQQAVEKFDIKYPVVLDNDYSTWRAYGNRYWPRKYLIDIDGYIVYDHIGEGGYEETEKKIQELLTERAHRLGTAAPSLETITQNPASPTRRTNSPEVYFGANRNELLSNGIPGQTGSQQFTAPATPQLNQLYLNGAWNIESEYALSEEAGASIIFRYRAKEVYMVASSETPANLTLIQDGQPLASPGSDAPQGQATVNEDQLYHLVSNQDTETHTLEIRVDKPSLKAFTFTFG